MPPDQDPSASTTHRSDLPQTRWSLILEAREENPEALADLCRQYWHPLYAYARKKGKSIEDAQDLTQSFMLHIVSKDFFGTATPERGRLRSLLLRSFQNYIVNEHRSRSAIKRGSGVAPLAIDAVSAEAWLAMEPTDSVTPEHEFDRQWARGILRQARTDLKDTYAEAGKSNHFDAFADQLEEGSSDRPYKEIAAEYDLPEEKARFICFKLRQRFRDRLVEIVAETVPTQEEAAGELDQLLQIFENPAA